MRLIKHPVLCNYYLTYRCNASCSFCDIWERPSPYITDEHFIHNLRDLKRLGVKVIDFTGGEPLLHQRLATFLEIARKQKFITTVTTNCLLYPKYAEKLKGKISMLHFSLDSATQKIHDESRGVKCFDFVLKSIQLAKQLGERPDILFTVHPKNMHEIRPIWENICLKNNLVLIINPIFNYNKIDYQEFTTSQLQELTKWASQKNVYLNTAFIALRKNGGNSIHKSVCRASSSTIVISPKNKLILPCYHLGLKEYTIDNQLFELWKSTEIQSQIEDQGTYSGCEGCVINCYMQPSFSTELNQYWLRSLPSTLKYNYMKGTWRELFK